MSNSSSTDTAHFGYPHSHTCQDAPFKFDDDRLACVTGGLERVGGELARAGTP